MLACGCSTGAAHAGAAGGDASSSDAAAEESGSVDASPDAAGASDAAASDAPVVLPPDAAPPTAPPAAQYLGGPILSSPRIVTVTFQGDDAALVARLQAFDDAITSTPWWHSVSAEYCVEPAGAPCVGAGSGAGHAVLAAAASQYTDSVKGGDSTMRALLTGAVSSGTLPPPDPQGQTLYVVYLPAGTTVLLDGNASCAPSAFGSYHDVVSLAALDAGAPVSAAYAVVARCSSTEAATTAAASHEIVEAATDPSPEDAPAYQLTDMVWTAFGPEVADACAAVDTSLTTVESGFTVQRSWSNLSAAAGHDPCVPVPSGEAYFNVAPAQGAETLRLSVGASATVVLYPFADSPDAAPWQLTAVAASGSPLDLAVQPATVRAGAPAVLTVTLASKPALGVDQLYGLVSQSQTDTHVWPMIVQAQ